MPAVFDNMWISQIRDWISSPLGILIMSCLLVYISYVHSRREHPAYDDDDYEREGHIKLPTPLQNLKLTRQELKTYDSKNPNGRYLVAFLDKIYDVSCSPQDFGPNGGYHELTGTDIMWYVGKTARYESRGFEAYVEECEKRLEDRFFVAGELLEDESPAADSDSDSGWNTVEESTTDTELEDIKINEKTDEIVEKLVEKVGDTEEMPILLKEKEVEENVGDAEENKADETIVQVRAEIDEKDELVVAKVEDADETLVQSLADETVLAS